MKKNNLKRFLASLLAVLMLSQVTGVAPGVFAEGADYEQPILQSGEAVLFSNADEATVKQVLAKALIANYDKCDPNTRDNLDWQYYCESETYLSKTKTEWVSVNGHSYWEKIYKYEFKSLANNSNGTYDVRLKGTETQVQFTKLEPKQSSIALTDYENGIKVPYNNDGSIDYAQLKERILDKVVTNPVDADHSSITIEYLASPDLSKLGENTLIDKITEAAKKEWTPLEGGSHKVIGIPVPYFAMTAGENTIKLSWGGNDTYYGCSSDEFTVKFLDRESAPLQRNDVSEIGIVYKEDLSVDYEATMDVIRNTLATSTDTEIVKTSDLKVEYQTATNYKDFGSDADIKPGTQKAIRLSWNGNADYSAWSEKFTVTFVDGRDPAFKLKDGVKDAAPEIGLVFTDTDTGVAIDYEAAETAIREALVEKLANVDLEKISVQYKSAGQAVDLNYKPSTVLGKAFGEGDFEIVLSWGGNKDYRSFSETVNVKMIDNRIASEIKVVADPSITYDKDGSAEKAAIIANVIDYTNSTLPAGAEFTVEVPNIDTPLGTTWKDITDNTMDAGENQKIRISFAGNAEYKPCEIVTYINVKKAPVSITLPIISKLYAGEEVDPETYYEVNPKDPAIDVYLFFVGINTNKETCVNVKLTPTQEKIIKALPGGVYDTLRNGMKLSEFKEFIESIPNIDKIEVIKNILNILNTFDNITDNTVIALGTPAHAGVYQAIAVSPETKNYEAGRGTGSLIILKNWKNIKLEKNPVLNSGDKANTINVSQAEELKAGNNLCILTKDGKPLNSASAGSIHYWFTGVNKIYAKNVMPTAPGRYIVTATVRGGDFFAFPKTFSFTIVADSTPNT